MSVSPRLNPQIMDLTGQSGGASGMSEAVGQTANCNVSNCPEPYGCTGPSGGKGGVTEHDSNGSATPNPPGTGKGK